MEKRRKKRFARRLQVRYWPKGERHARKGYTTNVSTSGVFVATNAPVSPGTRLRVEFLGESGFIIEAVVAHAARVSTALQSIRSSGMGLRFLEISELIRELLPSGSEYETETIGEADRARALGSASETEGDRILERAEEKSARELRDRATGSPTTYTVSFRNVAYLLDAIENEITFGGVFVATDKPAALQQDVRVALALPSPIKRTVHAEAVVVKLDERRAEGGGPATRGMGVAFKDGPKVLAELNRLIEGARPKRGEE